MSEIEIVTSLEEAVSAFAQITYTSSQWGYAVTAQRGDLSTVVVAQLVEAIDTQVDFERLPVEFPTPEQVAAFPARLIYGSVGQTHAWWHTAPAGRDESGRPGNIFVHVLVDVAGSVDLGDLGSAPKAPNPPCRPIEFWRATWWLKPFGAAEVGAQVPPEPERLRPDRAASREEVLGFLLDVEKWRIGVFPVILDALVAQARSGSVVLGVDSTEVAGLWVAACSLFLTREHARDFTWSLWERPSDVPRLLGRGISLICVPRGRLAEVPPHPGLVILTDDEADYEASSTYPGVHRAASGLSIPVTPMSVLATSVVSLGGDVDAVFDELEIVASESRTATSWQWPLAMAILRQGDVYADVDTTALAVVNAETPTAILDAPSRVADLTRLLERIGTSTADTWAACEAAGAEQGLAAVAWRRYVRAALRDPEWLSRPGGAPHRTDLSCRIAGDLELEDEVMAILRTADRSRGLDEAVRILHVVDFAVREGFDLHVLPEALELQVENLVEHCMADRAWSASPEVISRCGPLSSLTQERIVRPVLANWDRMDGSYAPGGELLDWLYPTRALPSDTAWTWLDVEAARNLLATASDGEREAVQSAALAAVLTPEVQLIRSAVLERLFSRTSVPLHLLAETRPELFNDLPPYPILQALVSTASLRDEAFKEIWKRALRRWEPAGRYLGRDEVGAVLDLIHLVSQKFSWVEEDVREILNIAAYLGAFDFGSLVKGEVRAALMIGVWSGTSDTNLSTMSQAVLEGEGGLHGAVDRILTFLERLGPPRPGTRSQRIWVALLLSFVGAQGESPLSSVATHSEAALATILADADSTGDLTKKVQDRALRFDKEEVRLLVAAASDEVNELGLLPEEIEEVEAEVTALVKGDGGIRNLFRGPR